MNNIGTNKLYNIPANKTQLFFIEFKWKITILFHWNADMKGNSLNHGCTKAFKIAFFWHLKYQQIIKRKA